MKNEDVPGHLAAIGQVMYRLIGDLEAGYADQPAYRVLQRVFVEHFVLVEEAGEKTETERVRVKAGEELSASSLQSPDDWEATYREKHGRGHRGYVANLTETCDSENEVQLITEVQVAPNTQDDEQLLVEALPELKARTDLDEVWTDGGYNGPTAEAAFREHQVEHVSTNVRGGHPAPERLGLDAFEWEMDETGRPVTVICSGGQQAQVQAGRKRDRFLASFEDKRCQSCAQRDRCPTQPGKRRGARVLRVYARAVQVARLRQRVARTRGRGKNRRAGVESTVRSVTHPFGGHTGKLPVRGQIRVTQVVICSALMVNVRRIWRHEQAVAAKKEQDMLSFLSRCRRSLRAWLCHPYIHRLADLASTFAQT